MAWRCCNCNRIYPGPDPEAAVECCQPDVDEVPEDDTEECPDCKGFGLKADQQWDEECPYCLGTGLALKPGVHEPLPGSPADSSPLEICGYCNERPLAPGADRCQACLDFMAN
jgi:hypothetical protein